MGWRLTGRKNGIVRNGVRMKTRWAQHRARKRNVTMSLCAFSKAGIGFAGGKAEGNVRYDELASGPPSQGEEDGAPRAGGSARQD